MAGPLFWNANAYEHVQCSKCKRNGELMYGNFCPECREKLEGIEREKERHDRRARELESQRKRRKNLGQRIRRKSRKGRNECSECGMEHPSPVKTCMYRAFREAPSFPLAVEILTPEQWHWIEEQVRTNANSPRDLENRRILAIREALRERSEFNPDSFIRWMRESHQMKLTEAEIEFHLKNASRDPKALAEWVRDHAANPDDYPEF